MFKDLTKVDVPIDIDIVLVAPKGSGRTVRTLFREGRGINSSIAVYQDVTSKAEEKAVALGIAVGSGYLYKTTFEKEVWSDLYGERGCLMGGIHGMFLAQYEVLRERGHSPSEAFNETVEEATQSLYPLIGANGMDWMYAACSTTARRGAIDWSTKFKDTLKPVFNELYDSVKNGTETKRALDFNSQPDYREKLEAELKTIRELEIWRAGKAVRFVEPIYFDAGIVTDNFLEISPTGESGVNRYPKSRLFLVSGVANRYRRMQFTCLQIFLYASNFRRDLHPTLAIASSISQAKFDIVDTKFS